MKKNISKVLCVLLTMTFVLSVATMPIFASNVDWATLTGQRYELSTATTDVEAGDIVEVEVKISDPKDLIGGQYTLEWDPELIEMHYTVKLGTKKYSFTPPQPDEEYEVSMTGTAGITNTNFVDEGKFIIAYTSDIETKYQCAYPADFGAVGVGTLKFTILEAAKGKDVSISVVPTVTKEGSKFNGSYFATFADGNKLADAPVNVTFKVAGDGPVIPTAETIGLATEAGKELQNVAVTNKDGSEYVINSALAFVSCVDTDKAEPVKTVITRDGSDKELVIAADSKTEIGSKTYFVAAVSSIKDSSFGKVFTAQAYAKAVVEGVEYEVAGVEATGIYDAE